MLVNIDKKPVTRIPHREFFDACRSRLTEEQYEAIIDELHDRVEGGEVHTSSWIPGADWRGTVFQPIYDLACREDPDAAARFFGLALWDAMQRHPDPWAFGRYKLDDIDIRGLTYFRVEI